MKKLISEKYRKQNAMLHEQNKKYGSAGHAWTDRVFDYLRDARATSYLDYGCGKGQLADAIQNAVNKTASLMGVYRYDPVTQPHAPPACDFVSCCDVLEHCEPKYLSNVLEDIASLIGVRGLLVISMRPSNKKLPDGRNAHLIIEGEQWWLARLEPFFDVEIVDPIKEKRRGVELAVLVRPKRAGNTTVAI